MAIGITTARAKAQAIAMKFTHKNEEEIAKKTVIIHPHPQFNVGVNLCQMLPVMFVAIFVSAFCFSYKKKKK